MSINNSSDEDKNVGAQSINPSFPSLNAPKPMISDPQNDDEEEDDDNSDDEIYVDPNEEDMEEDKGCNYAVSAGSSQSRTQFRINETQIHYEMIERRINMIKHYYINPTVKGALICYLIITIAIFCALLLVESQKFNDSIIYETETNIFNGLESRASYVLPDHCQYNETLMNKYDDQLFLERNKASNDHSDTNSFIILSAFGLIICYLFYILILCIKSKYFVYRFGNNYIDYCPYLVEIFDGNVDDLKGATPPQLKNTEEFIIEDVNEEEIP